MQPLFLCFVFNMILFQTENSELVEFDQQFQTWEDQFAKWKEENKDHPDKAALAKYIFYCKWDIIIIFDFYRYEEQWTKWREDLLNRRKEIVASSNSQPVAPPLPVRKMINLLVRI